MPGIIGKLPAGRKKIIRNGRLDQLWQVLRQQPCGVETHRILVPVAPDQYKISFCVFGFHQFPELGKFGFADLRSITESRIMGIHQYHFVPKSRIIPGNKVTPLQHKEAHWPGIPCFKCKPNCTGGNVP